MAKQTFLIVFSLIICGLVVWLLLARKRLPQAEVILNGQTLIVEVANNQLTRTQGLSGRQGLAQNRGMLFVFPEKQKYPFWMKGMNFALDFIWLNDNKITGLAENVPPPVLSNNQPQVVMPPTAVNKVLELKAGTIKDLNLKIGDQIQIIPSY